MNADAKNSKELPPLVHKTIPDRLTQTLNVYHIHAGEQPHAIQIAVNRELETSDEVYTRRLTASEAWQEIDLGWLKDKSGSICIENLEGRSRQFNPTPEEKQAASGRTIELSNGNPDGLIILVRPTWPICFEPKQSKLFVRCQSDKASFRLTAFPR